MSTQAKHIPDQGTLARSIRDKIYNFMYGVKTPMQIAGSIGLAFSGARYILGNDSPEIKVEIQGAIGTLALAKAFHSYCKAEELLKEADSE